MSSVWHICIGAFNRPDHECSCDIDRNHTEAEHKAAMSVRDGRTYV